MLIVRKNPLFCLLLVAVVFSYSSTWADEWPGWMGAERDGVYRESGIIERIPDAGLPIKWRVPIAGGYSGPAVADGKVFVFDYVKESGEAVNDPGTRANLQGKERLTALNETTGKVIWRHEYNCPYAISYPAGPRCTPTIHQGLVYLLGAEGDLQCLNADDGTIIWKQNLKQQFQVEAPMWGFSAHPLIDGDLLYTMVGGDGQSVVAFDRHTGKVQWKAISDTAGYCPPTIIEIGTTRQLIVYHPKAVSSLDPVSGEENWSIPIKPAYEMAIARPVTDGNKMYVSGIRNEAVMIELAMDQPAARELWRGKPNQAVFSANATPMFVDGVVYGADCNVGSFVAVDGKDGTRLWATFDPTQPDEKRRVSHGTAFATRIGRTDRYILMSETGDLLMARLTPEKYEPLGRFHVVEPTETAMGRAVIWSHPAYANQTAYIRNDQEIVAVDLKAAN